MIKFLKEQTDEMRRQEQKADKGSCQERSQEEGM